jgi:hypothetical protein
LITLLLAIVLVGAIVLTKENITSVAILGARGLATGATTGQHDLLELIAAVRAVQADCTRKRVDIDIGHGGGFASKFQFFSAKAMSEFRRGRQVRLIGHFGAYSGHDICKVAIGNAAFNVSSFTCYFESERSDVLCSQAANARATQAQLHRLASADSGLLYRAVQQYFFRPSNRTMAAFYARAKDIAFPLDEDNPHISKMAMHVRRGDKLVDKHKFRSTEAYERAAKQWLMQSVVNITHDQHCIIYVASDSASPLREIQQFFRNSSFSRCEVVGANTVTQKLSSDSTDMAHILQGVSNHVKHDAMLDILFDIYMLSQTRIIIGIVSSQISRLAAGLQRADALAPIAMDFENLSTIKRMSTKWGIPVMQDWEPPDKR